MQRFEAVARSADTAFVLSADWKLLRTNDAWKRFALENGGAAVLERWPDDSSIDGVIPPVLWPFYRAAHERVHATGQHWEHDYECSSADVYRLMHMVVYPVEADSVLVVSSPVIVRPHTRQVVSPEAYQHQSGVIVACCHCRRYRSPSDSSSWHWVPDFMRDPPPRVSHGLCPACLVHYYPE